MARVNKLYEKPLITSIALTDKVTVGQLVNGEYKVKTMLYSDFLAQIVDDTLVLVVTRAQLQALITASSLAIGVRYIITNAVGSTLSLLIQAVSPTVLDEIAVNTTDGENYKYNIVTDTAILISNPIALGTANQLLGVNAGATAQEYKTVQGTANRVSVNHTANAITITTPQDIATTSNVEFAKLNLNNIIPLEDEFAIIGQAINDSIGTVDNAYFISSLDLLTNAVADATYLTTIDGISAGGELEGNYASPTLKNSSVIGKVLTGLSVTGSAVVSTDSVLAAIGKLQNQVNGLAGGVEYQGTWNASTNTPTLTSSVGTQGFYYVVSVAGSTNLDGIINWELGDWAIFNGTAWQKVDNTDAVVSVNGYTGIVTLSAADVSAVPTTRTVSTTSPLAGGGDLTADLTLSIPQSSGSVNGYLASTDWTTFNNKQNALTNPITGTGTTNYLPKFTGASALGNSSIFDNGNVGIGTNSPAYLLDVNGTGRFSGTITSSTGNNTRLFTSIGATTGYQYMDMNNTAGRLVWGINGSTANALASNSLANGGVLYALNSLQLGVDGDMKLTIASSGAATFSSSVTAGADATINGVTVGKGAGNLSNNTAVGASALNANTTGAGNTSIGANSLLLNTTGSYNTGNGLQALLLNTTGGSNTAVGYTALNNNSTGNNNTAMGVSALLANTASNNTAVGFESAFSNTSGSITAIGYQAGRANTTGAVNTALGNSALILNTTGSANTAIGAGCLADNTTGSHNTAIGRSANSGNFDASVILGRDATATASNQFVVGSAAYPAGAVATEVNASTKVWNVVINGVAQKILLA